MIAAITVPVGIAAIVLLVVGAVVYHYRRQNAQARILATKGDELAWDGALQRARFCASTSGGAVVVGDPNERVNAQLYGPQSDASSRGGGETDSMFSSDEKPLFV